MRLKRIVLFFYFILVIASFTNTVQINKLAVGATELFFGVVLPYFSYWQLHLWFIQADKETDRSWVYWAVQLFYTICLILGVTILVNIYIDPSNAVFFYMILPLVQGFVFWVALTIMAHIAIYAQPRNQNSK